MKGIVFNELLNLVEEKFGLETADEIIEENNLASGGAYAATGTYDAAEILALVTSLSQKTGASVRDLVIAFGHHLASVFVAKYPPFFEKEDYFDFLRSIDGFIHVEVKKLYPDAELPKFTFEQVSEEELILKYRSSRPFADLAEGLLLAVASHYEVDIDLKTEDVDQGRDFRVIKRAG